MDANSKKHSNLNRSLLFAPVAIEILGVLSPKVKAFVSELAQRVAAVPRSHQFLVQRLSVAVQHENTAAVLGSIGVWDTT